MSRKAAPSPARLQPEPWPQRISCFKRTTDDWHPSHALADWYNGTPPGGVLLVEVSLITLTDGKTRVCVWGADDTGMERDFDGALEARAMWHTVLAHEVITKAELTRLGFVYA